MKIYLRRAAPAAVAALILFVLQASAQVTPSSGKGRPTFPDAKVGEFRLASKLMAREMPYRVILPDGYAAAGNAARYPVIYLLHGLTGSYADWTEKTKLVEYSSPFKFIIVTPEGNNGWYTDIAGAPNENYESYIVKELVPEIDKNFRTRADRAGRAVAGLSMGGFGALKFGLKYPEMFALAGSFSGAVFASSYRTTDDLPAGEIRKALTAVFGEGGSPTQKANDIAAVVRDGSSAKVKSFPFLYVSCGTEDFLFQNNRDFAALLVEKKVPHEYRQLPGAHDWPFWNAQVLEFLRLAEKRLTAE